MPSLSYQYAIGRIRALEDRFLDSAYFARLGEVNSAGAAKLLADRGFGADCADRSDPDALLVAEGSALKAQIDELTPDRALTDLFWLPADATNLKLLFKSRVLGDELGSLTLDDGIFEHDTLREAVASGEYGSLGDWFGPGMERVERALEDKRDIRDLSGMIDNLAYGFIFDALRKKKNPACSNYFETKALFANILSLLRARALGWGRFKTLPMLIALPGGPSAEELAETLERPAAETADIFEPGPRKDAVRAALEAYSAGASVSAASASLAQSLSAVAASERWDSEGIGPVIYYLTRRQDELARLRVLFAGKRARKAV